MAFMFALFMLFFCLLIICIKYTTPLQYIVVFGIQITSFILFTYWFQCCTNRGSG